MVALPRRLPRLRISKIREGFTRIMAVRVMFICPGRIPGIGISKSVRYVTTTFAACAFATPLGSASSVDVTCSGADPQSLNVLALAVDCNSAITIRHPDPSGSLAAMLLIELCTAAARAAFCTPISAYA